MSMASQYIRRIGGCHIHTEYFTARIVCREVVRPIYTIYRYEIFVIRCLSGWEAYGQRCFQIFNTEMVAMEARAVCKRYGHTL